MHAIDDPLNIVARELVERPEVTGKECCTCLRILSYNFFRRDASYRDGHRDQCQSCETSPRLSIAEQTMRMREMNNSSEAVRRQRYEHQDEYRNDTARVGRPMHHSDFLRILRQLVPSLYFADGGIVGDVAIFQTSDRPREDWGGKDFKYLFYCPTGVLPEFSQYEFDTARDVPIREKQRGWRTPLLRLIQAGLLREETCGRVFGPPSAGARSVWDRHLYVYRNHGS